MSWDNSLCYLRIVDLKQQALLSVLWVSLFSHSVTRSSDLDKFLDVYSSLERSGLDWGLLSLLGRSPGEVALMLLTLSVGKVGGLVIMESQTQLALKRSKMISHEIWILGQVDGLRRQGSQPLPPVPIGLGVRSRSSTPCLGSNSVLEIHLGDSIPFWFLL